MISFLIFILILSVLVLIHELGHFVTAKKLGIQVDEFGLGIPPRIWSKKIGETTYSLNLLPFGGFVKVVGEEIEPGHELELTTNPRSFASKTPGQRILVLGAGVFMNFVLAVVIFYFVLASNSYKTQYIPTLFDTKFRFGTPVELGTVVFGMLEDSSAAKAGIEAGEAVLSIDGEPVKDVFAVREVLKDKLGKEVSVLLKDIKDGDSGTERVVKMMPQTDEKGNVILGVFLAKSVMLDYSNGTDKYLAGFLHSYNVTAYSLTTLGRLIGLSVEEKTLTPVSESVAGPVGIYHVVDGFLNYGGNRVFYHILDFVGLMSVSLAFMNILPIPALDGGRILFVFIEKLRGKPVSPKIENELHKYGFIALLGLLVLITIKDILQW